MRKLRLRKGKKRESYKITKPESVQAELTFQGPQGACHQGEDTDTEAEAGTKGKGTAFQGEFREASRRGGQGQGRVGTPGREQQVIHHG